MQLIAQSKFDTSKINCNKRQDAMEMLREILSHEDKLDVERFSIEYDVSGNGLPTITLSFRAQIIP
jgi:hypothetical protein